MIMRLLNLIRWKRVRFERYRIDSSRHDSGIERRLHRKLRPIRGDSIRLLTAHIEDEPAT